MTASVIVTRGLTHRFGSVTALDQVDLTVSRGEIYGFLGRNGAGKTTLIRSLLGLITPTEGRVTLLGTDVRGGRTPARLWADVGYLVEGPGLYPDLTVIDHLRIASGYRGLAPSAVGDALERLDLGRYAGVRARALSLGNRQRLGLAGALIHRPPLVILDEPVNGLDPAGVVDVRRLLRELADSGVTVFMSTHLIAEVARLADRVGIIHGGHLIEELSGERLIGAGHRRLVLRFRTAELAVRAQAALRESGMDAVVGHTSLEVTTPEAIRQPDLIATRLVEAGAAPTYLAVEQTAPQEDLERLFLRLTGRLPEKAAA